MKNELLDFVKSRKKANLSMVILNICVYLLIEILSRTGDGGYLFYQGAMYPPAVQEQGEYYRLLTCMFLHFGIQHLAYNMLILVFAGDMLEQEVGAVKYLIIYLGGGVLGNLLSYAVSIGEEVISAGASGGIFAVIGALVWIVVRNKGNTRNIDGRGLCIMAALSLVQGFFDVGVDHFAHLGGALAGFALGAALYRRKKTAI